MERWPKCGHFLSGPTLVSIGAGFFRAGHFQRHFFSSSPSGTVTFCNVTSSLSSSASRHRDLGELPPKATVYRTDLAEGAGSIPVSQTRWTRTFTFFVDAGPNRIVVIV